jgi:hypothetical protein
MGHLAFWRERGSLENHGGEAIRKENMRSGRN